MTEKICEKCGKTVDIRGFYQHHKNCKGTLQGAGTEIDTPPPTTRPPENSVQTVPPPIQSSAPIQQTAPPAAVIPASSVPANKIWNGYIYQGD